VEAACIPKTCLSPRSVTPTATRLRRVGVGPNATQRDPDPALRPAPRCEQERVEREVPALGKSKPG